MEDDLDGDLREEQGSREAEGKDDHVDDDVVEADDAGSGSGSEDEEEEDDDDDDDEGVEEEEGEDDDDDEEQDDDDDDDDDDEAAAETVLAVAISRERPKSGPSSRLTPNGFFGRGTNSTGPSRSTPPSTTTLTRRRTCSDWSGACCTREWPEVGPRAHTMEVNGGGGIERCLPLHLACEYSCLALHGNGSDVDVERGQRDKAEMVRLLVEAHIPTRSAKKESRRENAARLLALEHFAVVGVRSGHCARLARCHRSVVQ
jgi:hypothetical protein